MIEVTYTVPEYELTLNREEAEGLFDQLGVALGKTVDPHPGLADDLAAIRENLKVLTFGWDPPEQPVDNDQNWPAQQVGVTLEQFEHRFAEEEEAARQALAEQEAAASQRNPGSGIGSRHA